MPTLSHVGVQRGEGRLGTSVWDVEACPCHALPSPPMMHRKAPPFTDFMSSFLCPISIPHLLSPAITVSRVRQGPPASTPSSCPRGAPWLRAQLSFSIFAIPVLTHCEAGGQQLLLQDCLPPSGDTAILELSREYLHVNRRLLIIKSLHVSK